MLETLNLKRIKFISVSVAFGLFLIFSKQLLSINAPLYGLFLLLFCLGTLLPCLEAFQYKKLWFYISVIPFHLAAGAFLSFVGFPNLSLPFRFVIAAIVSLVYYATLLVLNIFIVVETRRKSIPLYRVANTWSQILIVIASIPFYAGVFKLPIHPLLQVGVVTISSFTLILFFLKLLELEVGVFDLNLAVLTDFWIALLSISILFLPFEASFRGLFLSSVLLFGLGYIQGYLKHTLTKRILLEYLIITISFLFIGLLFVP